MSTDRLTATGECDAVRLNNTRRLVVDDTNTRSAAWASAYRILTAWSGVSHRASDFHATPTERRCSVVATRTLRLSLAPSLTDRASCM